MESDREAHGLVHGYTPHADEPDANAGLVEPEESGRGGQRDGERDQRLEEERTGERDRDGERTKGEPERGGAEQPDGDRPDGGTDEEALFSEKYLLKRPLLEQARAAKERERFGAAPEDALTTAANEIRDNWE